MNEPIELLQSLCRAGINAPYILAWVLLSLDASPLDLSRLIALLAVVSIHTLQADIVQADTRATPCSQPLQRRDSWHWQRHQILELGNAFNIIDCCVSLIVQ